VRDPATGRLVAGCRVAPDRLELAHAERVIAAMPAGGDHPWERNTTLVAVLTDAALTKNDCLKISQMTFGALHRTLVPALSLYDGDLVATLARGERRAHLHQVAVLAQAAAEAAILRAVLAAEGFAGLPAARDLPP